MKLSAVLITKNEAANLPRCLASLQGLADEIIVVDSASTDDTAAIAEAHGAKVHQHPFNGYGEQKRVASDLASHAWVLNIDADEEVSPALRTAILKTLESPQHSAYQFARLTNYCGSWIRHCGWYPDRVLRLWDKTKGHMREDKVHEGWEPDNAADIGTIAGDLYHYSSPSICNISFLVFSQSI